MNSIPAFDTSEDDDFSFIVVDRMTADDSDKIENEIMASVRGLSMNRTLGNSSRSVFFSEDSSSLPPGVVPNEELISRTFHGHASLPLDVQQRMESLIEDNSKLQVTVDQTNFALKQMMMTLSQWRMDTETLRQDHKEKFQETRNLVLKLKEEKAEMRIVIEELNKKIQELEATSAMPSLIETVVPAVSDLELESVINDLKSKLEVSEATHIAEKEKNEAYSNELTDLNDKIKVLQRELEALRPEIVDYQMKESRLLEELKLLREENSTLHCKLETPSSLESVTNDLKSKLEVSEATQFAEEEKNEAHLNELTDLNDKIKVLQRELEALRPEIVDYQMKESRLLEELKLLREENSTLHCKLETFSSLERHSNDYQSAQTEGFTKRIDELTTKLMYSDEQVVQLQHEILLLKEREKLMDDGCEELRTAQSTVDRLRIRADSMTAVIVDLEDKNAFNTQKILKLEAENNELKRENEAIGILQAQVEVYRTDFLAERDARERLVGEKEHLAADLRRLHRLNVTLVEREQRNPSAPESESGQEFEQPTETADQAASTYRCPVCGVRTFRTLDSLNEHIDGCLNPAE